MKTSKTKNTTLQWHTGRPTQSGTYLVALGQIEDGRYRPRGISPVITLPYSARHQSWNWYDRDEAPDEEHTQLWDNVLAWASMDTLATSLDGWAMDRGDEQ